MLELQYGLYVVEEQTISKVASILIYTIIWRFSSETDLDNIYGATVNFAIYQSITVKGIVDVIDPGQLLLSYCLQK